MILTTPRLILRRFLESDLDDFSSLMADPEVMRFSIRGPTSKDQSKEFLKNRILDHYQKYGYGLWAVIYRENGHFIGFSGLMSQTINGARRG